MLKKEHAERLLSQMSAVAQKVYQAVPIEESWSHHEILREFNRIHGNTVDYRVIGGCISSLIASGLVRQTQRERYRREPVREKQQPKVHVAHANRHIDPPVPVEDIVHQMDDVQPKASAPVKTITKETVMSLKKVDPKSINAETAKKDPLERLLDLSERLAALNNTARSIAEEIGELAVELTDEREQVAREKQRLGQLRSLLSSLMAPEDKE